MKLQETLQEIDNLLARVEDTLHGTEGNGITEARGLLQKAEKQAESLESQNRWIPVEEDLPEMYKEVNVYSERIGYDIGRRTITTSSGTPWSWEVWKLRGDEFPRKLSEISHWKEI